jgi:hypothetical protein
LVRADKDDGLAILENKCRDLRAGLLHIDEVNAALNSR